MTSGIYGIFDYTSEECLYVGRSIRIEQRWREHIYDLKTDNHIEGFTEWFNLLNKDFSRLDFRVLEVVEDEENHAVKEREWFYNASSRFYRHIPTGNSKWYAGVVFNDDVRKKLSKASREYAANNPRPAPFGKDSSGRILKQIICSYKPCSKEHLVADLRIKFCSLECGAKNQFKDNVEKISKENLIDALNSFDSLEKIAKHLGCSRPTVKKYIKRYNLESLFTPNKKSLATTRKNLKNFL